MDNPLNKSAGGRARS